MSRQQSSASPLPSRNGSAEEKPEKKKNKALKVFGVIAAVIISILVITAVTLIVLMFRGQHRALGDNKGVDNVISIPSDTGASLEKEDSGNDTNTYVYYDGKKYKYNDKVTTILFAGIDKHVDEQLGTYGTAGQADSIIIAALDTETGKYKLLALSRDTMADVNVLKPDGSFKGTENQQICLAYAYGDGKEGSCENLKKSVSRVLFGIPINSYAAIDLDAIPILNDDVGGVNVNVIEDLSHKDPALILGANVTLYGKQAETFVRSRDVNGDENQNNLRMDRQKEYLSSFIKTTLSQTRSDIKTPLRLYNDVSDYMVTDIDASMITYYTSIFLKSGFSADDNFMKIPGTTTASEKYAEYYVDNDALFKIILDTYYTEVK